VNDSISDYDAPAAETPPSVDPTLGDSSQPAILVARDTKEGRAFLQQRLGQFAFVVLAIGVVFDLLANVAAWLQGSSPTRLLLLAGNQVHFLLMAALGVLVILLRSKQLPARALAGLDVAMMLFISTVHGVMGVNSPQAAHPALQGPDVTAASSMPMLTATLFVLLGRAIVVPSSARYTLVASLAGALPTLAAAHTLHVRYPIGSLGHTAAQQTIGASIWLAAGVALATVASRTIYLLHTRVQDAVRLGQYTLGDKIGEGGMGIVYKAHHALLRRPTALKLLPPDKAGAASLARFEREVQLTSRLTHANTVAIYDYGRTSAGVFYYVMEYLEGMNLEELVSFDGPQDPARVVHVLAQAAGALAEAHALGLVHRDVKPANIILCERGGVPDVAKVVDFGLARELPGQGESAYPAATSPTTILGTPLYLSPEAIATPDQIDGRADLYALGAVGYFLLTGVPVFEARTAIEACSHHLHTPVLSPSKRIHQEIPSDVEDAILCCLAKDPGARPQSALELRRLLLAARLEPWTDSRARDWWERVRQRGPRSNDSPGKVSRRALTMTVDLRRRDGLDAHV
jgi:serine/threonine-protein kinase